LPKLHGFGVRNRSKAVIENDFLQVHSKILAFRVLQNKGMKPTQGIDAASLSKQIKALLA
jgi:hypothetical protein